MKTVLLLVVAMLGFTVLAQKGSAEVSPLDVEAEAHAQQWLATIMTRCDGDVSISRETTLGTVYYQYRGATLQVEPAPLTEIDTMNAITWKGIFRVTVTAQRRLLRLPHPIQGFNVWQDWTGSYGLVFMVQKKTGDWHISQHEWKAPVTLQAIPCEVGLSALPPLPPAKPKGKLTDSCQWKGDCPK